MDQTSATTYKISFKKIARAAFAEVRVHKKLAIISYVLFGVSFLLAIFDSRVRWVNMDGHPGTGMFFPSSWGVVFAIAGIAVGYFTALNVFRDMNNQQLCDVSMALPIKASERFFSKLLCLFYLQTAPLILSSLVGYGVKVLYGYANFSRMEDDTLETLFMIVFGCLAASMFIMAIAVLCACCCGAFAESSYFSLILMFIINVMPLFYINNVVCGSAGISVRFYEIDYIFDLGYWGFLFLLSSEDFISHCAVGCVISLAVMLLSGLIYVKRDARSVGTPIASRLFFEIIMFTGCVTVFSLFVMSDAALWGLLIAGVIYIIINIIVSRAKINVLSFLKWIGKYAATTAVFTVLLVATIKTGGFGLINSRPDAKFLDGAKFDISYYPYYNYSHNRNTDFTSNALTAEQADEVIKICKKHIIKGRLDLSTVDIIFGNTDSSSTAPLYIDTTSNKPIREKPYPISYFREKFDGSYYLNYYQRITIPLSETEAMVKELTDLGYIRPKTEDDNYYTAAAL